MQPIIVVRDESIECNQEGSGKSTSFDCDLMTQGSKFPVVGMIMQSKKDELGKFSKVVSPSGTKTISGPGKIKITPIESSLRCDVKVVKKSGKVLKCYYPTEKGEDLDQSITGKSSKSNEDPEMSGMNFDDLRKEISDLEKLFQ